MVFALFRPRPSPRSESHDILTREDLLPASRASSRRQITGIAGSTRVMTDFGLVPAMLIRAGDRLRGTDGTWHPVVSISTLAFDAQHFADHPTHRGVRIPEGALGGGLPKAEMVLGPDQPLRRQDSAFDEGLTRASDHIGRAGIAHAPSTDVLFYQFRVSANVPVLVEGVPIVF